MKKSNYGFSTMAIHAGHGPEESTGAVMYPIFQTSTYAQEAPGVHKGYEYSRTGNPTRTVLEKLLAELEGGTFAFSFSSGLAALGTFLHLFSEGDHIICSDDCYGGTFRLIDKVFSKNGLTASFVDLNDEKKLEASLTTKTKVVIVETPTNPLLKIIDLKKLIAWAHSHSLLVIVDNTFMTPILQRPLDLGADVVLHSTTKYINGHSDVIGGALVTRNEELAERIGFLQNAFGAIPGPMDVWLTIRGIKTLPLRMEAHFKNAMRIALFLEKHPRVEKVIYPGLSTHAGHELAKKQMKNFGGMISFYLKKGDLNTQVFFKRLKLITLAESLGGVESLCEHPATMTHASLPLEQRLSLGISDELIRLSVGIEDAKDLEEDLAFALGG